MQQSAAIDSQEVVHPALSAVVRGTRRTEAVAAIASVVVVSLHVLHDGGSTQLDVVHMRFCHADSDNLERHDHEYYN